MKLNEMKSKRLVNYFNFIFIKRLQLQMEIFVLT